MGSGAIVAIMMVVVLTILIVGTIFVKKMLVVTDPNAQDVCSENEVSTAQEFIPIVDIKDGMIDLGNHRYRAVIECSSVNYNLKTNLEREIIELSFQKFISSLSFPITFHIQTKVIDNTVIVRDLEMDVQRLRSENETVMEYAEMYLESMRNFNAYIGNAKQKKKYIIVGYEEAYTLTELSDSEKRELSRQQLKDRVEFIRSQLASMQIRSEHLDSPELIDLVYNAYHRESAQYDLSEALAQGEFFSEIVSGEDKISSLTPEQKIDLELVKLQNLLKEEYLDARLGVEAEFYRKTASVYEGIDGLREKIGRPYEGDFSVKSIANTEKITKSNLNAENDIKTPKKDDYCFEGAKNKEKIDLDCYEDIKEDKNYYQNDIFDEKYANKEIFMKEKEEYGLRSRLNIEIYEDNDKNNIDENDEFKLDFNGFNIDNTSIDLDEGISLGDSSSLIDDEDSNSKWNLDLGLDIDIDLGDSSSLIDFDETDSNWSIDLDEDINSSDECESKDPLDLVFEEDEDLDIVIENKSEEEKQHQKKNRLLMFD